MRLRVALVGLVVLVSRVGAQQDWTAPAPELTAAIVASREASAARNVAEYAKYVADDWSAVNPSGVLNSRTQRLNALAQPAAQPAAMQRTESVRMYGPAAAVVRTKTGTWRSLSLWVRNPQGWQQVAVHVVPDSAPAQGAPAAALNAPQPSAVTAPSGLTSDQAAVFAVHKQLSDARFAGDGAAYQELTAPDFVRMTAGGMVVVGREGSISIVAPRAQPKFSNIAVHVWGSTGIVRWLETDAAGEGTWVTRVLARTASGWRQVTSATSRAATPPVQP